MTFVSSLKNCVGVAEVYANAVMTLVTRSVLRTAVRVEHVSSISSCRADGVIRSTAPMSTSNGRLAEVDTVSTAPIVARTSLPNIVTPEAHFSRLNPDSTVGTNRAVSPGTICLALHRTIIQNARSAGHSRMICPCAGHPCETWSRETVICTVNMHTSERQRRPSSGTHVLLTLDVFRLLVTKEDRLCPATSSRTRADDLQSVSTIFMTGLCQLMHHLEVVRGVCPAPLRHDSNHSGSECSCSDRGRSP
jgi:hypothetical protein